MTEFGLSSARNDWSSERGFVAASPPYERTRFELPVAQPAHGASTQRKPQPASGSVARLCHRNRGGGRLGPVLPSRWRVHRAFEHGIGDVDLDRDQPSSWNHRIGTSVRASCRNTWIEYHSLMALVSIVRSGALAVIVAACGDGSLPESTIPDGGASEALDDVPSAVVEYNGEGAVCLSPRLTGGTHVQVVLDACASFCARAEATCSVEVNDSAIQLTASGRATLEAPNLECPDECLPVEARCALPTLSEGTHVLRYGARSTSIVLPIDEPRTQVLSGNESSACIVVPVLD